MDDRDNIFDEFAAETLRLYHAASTTLEQLQSVFENHRAYLDGVVVSNKSRIKSFSSLSSKISRKRKLIPTYNVNDITDVVGFMFLTLSDRETRSALSLVTRILMDSGFIRHTAGRRELGEVSTREVTFYRRSGAENSDDGYSYGPEAQEFVGGATAKLAVPIRYVYRTRYNYGVISATVSTLVDGQVFNVPVEFQFKSLLTDALQQIDHRIFYGRDRFVPKGARGADFRGLEKLKVLQKLLDAADDYISGVLFPPDYSGEKSHPTVWIYDDRDWMAKLLEKAEIEVGLKEDILAAFAGKSALDSVANVESKSSQYIALAREFSSLSRDLIVERESFGEIENRILFALRIEEAACLLLTRAHELTTKAAHQLKSITTDEPAHPTGWFRLAQAIESQAEYQSEAEGWTSDVENSFREAFDAFQRARETISNLPLGTARRDLISEATEHYIAGHIDRLQAYTIWRMSSARRSSTGVARQDDFDDVTRALTISRQGLGSAYQWNPEKILNFMLEAREIGAQLDVSDELLPSIEEIREAVVQLSAEQLRTGGESISVLDTLLRGYRFLGDQAGELETAKKILDKVGSLQAHDGTASEVAVRRAWEAVRGSVT
jgi:ppGpp synthetase/RelA/SpoT-type nucleotidyltranferase